MTMLKCGKEFVKDEILEENDISNRNNEHYHTMETDEHNNKDHINFSIVPRREETQMKLNINI